jgi:small subunit ribosomal protein S14
MAKVSSIVRDEKRKRMIINTAKKRAALKAMGDYDALQKLPRNSSPTRWKNRCQVTGRPRAYIGKFGMGRVAFRDAASNGEIPGVRKASW